jgi:hypothetical protein
MGGECVREVQNALQGSEMVKKECWKSKMAKIGLEKNESVRECIRGVKNTRRECVACV